jgi:hypothetical protein
MCGGIKEECILDFGGKPEGKTPLGRPKHTWEVNIKLDLRETGWGGIGWIGLAQYRDQWRAIVNMVKNL